MMQAIEKSSVSTGDSLNEEQKDADRFITIPQPNDLQKSLQIMTEQQIFFNIIELNLTSIYNKTILDHLYRRSTQTKFYLMNRYILQNIMSVNQQSSPGSKYKSPKLNKKKKQISVICGKYDSIYVNGVAGSMKKEEKIVKEALLKEIRATFISEREQFINYLYQLSEQLKLKADQYDEEQLRHYFQSKLDTLNKCQLHNSISNKKLQILKNSCDSFGSNQDALSEVSSVDESPQKSQHKQTIFTMSYNAQVQFVKEIKIQSSGYFKTKNRFPLLLDFDFSRFIYKDDNQLGHQLIAMHMMKYLNRIISLKMKDQQIVEYQIIPENKGAFYEFMENSKTVGKIKEEYKGGIKEYLDQLENKYYGNSEKSWHISPIRKRFAQTFAGFSTAQYFLQIKDRNNENIMIRNDGSIFHIDLAFIFNATPGGINFQSAPFKFTEDYLQAMDGFQSDTFVYYQSLMISNFSRLLINKQQILTKIRILAAREDQIPCFKRFKLVDYENKFPSKIQKVREKIQDIISESYNNWRTKKYDDYQFKTNGIKL